MALFLSDVLFLQLIEFRQYKTQTSLHQRNVFEPGFTRFTQIGE